VIVVRRDGFRAKRLMLMTAVLLVAIMNPYYLRNLIGFLGYQYNLAANAASLWDNVASNVLTLRGWSEMMFGSIASVPGALFFDCCALLVGLLFLTGTVFLSRRDWLILGAVVLPALAVILTLATRIPFSYYPMAKIILTILPFLIGPVFVTLSKFAAKNQHRPPEVLAKLLCVMILFAAASGSCRYYSEVLNNEGLLKIFREPRFLNVCRELEKVKNKRVLVFETHPLLTAWLCYHARHNDVYFDGRLISDSAVPPSLPFSKIPDLENIDFVATRDRITELRARAVTCLTSVDDTAGEDRSDGRVRYWLGPR
jgi:hypothetical protein